MSSELTADNTWVLVCTYDRNSQLTGLLASLRSVLISPPSTVQVPHLIVVDNAPHRQAESTVREHYPEATYLHQPQPGLVAARNASLDAIPPEAEAVIFLDDDEQVTSDWLLALLNVANSSDADAVGGPVAPVFIDGEPEWVASYGYVRRTDFPTGPHQRRLATNNTLVRSHWFRENGMRFDEAFNSTGGEDSDLFERMLGQGAEFWWAADALVTEDVPAERADQEWLRARALRGGAVRAMKRRRRRSEDPCGTAQALAQIAAEGLARAGYGALRRSMRRLRQQPVTYTDDYYLCEGVGMLASLAGQRHEEYARSDD